jgi:hypothetical protein
MRTSLLRGVQDWSDTAERILLKGMPQDAAFRNQKPVLIAPVLAEIRIDETRILGIVRA